MQERCNRVFVYGTLKRGQRNNHYLQASQFVGSFATEAVYSMYEFDDYPAVALAGRHAIMGEVYRINEHEFRRLDELENYPDFYQRIQIPTRYGDAWMYVVRRELCSGRRQLDGFWPWA